MSPINIKPYESNLGGNFYRIGSSRLDNKESDRSTSNIKTNKVSGTLSIDINSSEKVSLSPESKKVTARERVENRASNQLLSASLVLTTRSSLNDELIDGVSKLKSIASDIKKEVNPINKQKLVDEANSLAESLTNQFNNALEEDPTLTDDFNVSVLLSPSSNAETSNKYTQISITSLSSPNSSGLEGIDFSDADSAIDQIDLTLTNLKAKQSQLDSVSTDISQNTSLAISSLKVQSNTLENQDQDGSDENVVTEVTQNFLG